MKTLLLKMLSAVILFILPTAIFAQAPNLGTAADFVLFSTNGAVSNTGISQLTGNVGTNNGSSTGFGNVNGQMHDADGVTAQAATDLLIAYNQLNTATPTFFPAPILGNGDVLIPGVYSIPAAASLNLDLTLDAQGDPNAVFIFQIQGPFSTNANSKIKLINGALACNVYWKVEGLVSMSSGTSMKGTIIANNAAINMNTGDTLEGRALSTTGAVTVDGVFAYTSIGCGSLVLSGPTAPNLASAVCYTIFSSDGPVTNSGITNITGDVGTNVGLTTGFNPLFVTGTIHPIPDGSTAACASDLLNAYAYLDALPYDIELLYPAQFGNNLVLTPHTYIMNGATTFTDTLYLNARDNANAVFIIKIKGALSTSTYSKVILINGAQAKNVFWVIDGAVSINDYSIFNGTIVCNNGAIDLTTGVTLNGRALTTTGALMTTAITATMPPGCIVLSTDSFISTWQVATGETISIPTEVSETYNFYINWGDGTSETVTTQNPTHTYTSAGAYSIKIHGDFPRIYFNNTGSKDNILSVDQWGPISWSSFENAFYGCTNLATVPAAGVGDAPDLGAVTSLTSMFRNASTFNTDISHWNVSNVTTMASMFEDALSFNQDMSSWNVSSVIIMDSMFRNTSAFNQSLGSWDLSDVTTMSNMLSSSSLDICNYDATLTGWAANLGGTTPNGIPLGAFGLNYCAAASDRAALVTASWTILDDLLLCPAIVCPSNIFTLSAPSSCDAIVNYTLPTVNSSCPGLTITQTQGLASGSAFPLGVTVNEFELTYGSYTETCSFTVEVHSSPTISCVGDQTINSDLGVCTFTVQGTEFDASFVPSCYGGTLTNNFNGTSSLAGQILSLGDTTVTWTVDDGNGNIVSCTTIFTVEDSISPTITCIVSDIRVSDAGVCSYTVQGAEFDPTSFNDNCTALVTNNVNGTATLDGAALPFGVNTVIWTVMDLSGNFSTCSLDITVQDVEAPQAVCQNITVALDIAGQAVITPQSVDAGSADNCSIASFSLDQATFDCSNIGLNSVTLTVTDFSGNTSFCTAIITIEDLTPPSFSCQPYTYDIAIGGSVSVDPLDLVTGVYDNCGGVTFTTNISGFNCDQTGIYSVLVTGTDGNGNSSSCYSSVTINNNGGPVVSCQNVTLYLDANGQAILSPSQVSLSGSAPCGDLVLSLSHSTFNCSDIGTQMLTLTATDSVGNSSSCTSTVTILDTVSPVAICQDIDLYLDANGQATLSAMSLDNGSSDLCGSVQLFVSQEQFNCSDLGKNNVFLSVLDPSGNVSTCLSSVTVKDTIVPTISCISPTINMGVKGHTSIDASQLASSSDNCGGVVFTASTTYFTCSDVGTVAVTVTATDASGNSSVCISNVTVVDLNGLQMVCKDTILSLDATGYATITPADVTASLWATCGFDTTWLSTQQFGCSDIGVNSVTVYATTTNGLTDSCTAQVTVIDNTLPLLFCDTSVVYLDAQGGLQLSINDLSVAVSDNCGIQSLEFDSLALNDCSSIGFNTVVVTATDVHGNVSTCSSVIEVRDTLAPAISCLNTTVYLDANGLATLMASSLIGSVGDNCGIASLTQGSFIFDCTQLGTQTVSLTATDYGGNTSTCVSTITVLDNLSPVAICQPGVFSLDVSGIVILSPVDVLQSFSDNCVVSSMSVSPSAFDCSQIGDHLVVVTVTDGSGNETICQTTVTIVNTSSISITCNPDMLLNNEAGLCGATAVFPYPFALNGCDTLVVTQTDGTGLSSGSFFPIGTTQLAYSATGPSGASTSCSFNLTIHDTQAPNFVACAVDAVVNNDPGVSGAIVQYSMPSIVDNCTGSNVSLATGLASGSLFPIGTTQVVYIGSDASGNTDTCAFSVTVLDNEAPQLNCPIGQTLFNNLGQCGAVAVFNSPVVITNIGGGLVTLNRVDFTGLNSGDEFPVGVTTLIWEAVDAAGNVATCTINIAVVDNEQPVFTCSANVVQSNDPSQCGAVINLLVPAVLDNCPGVSVVQTAGPTSGSLFPAGVSVVTFVATDASGNMASCSYSVTIEDNEPPVIVCPADIIVPADPILCGALVNYTWPTAIDNCSSQVQLTNSGQNPNSLFQLGTTTVTFTATDDQGNTTTCSFDVTVTNQSLVNLGPDVASCGSRVLVPTGSNGGTYLWSTGEQTQSIVANQTGSYWVEVTWLGGCIASDTVNVSVFASPTASIVGLNAFYCLDAGVMTLLGSPAGGTFSGQAVTGGVFDPTLSFGQTEVYYTYVDANACIATAHQTVTVQACLSQEEFTDQSIELFPNPTSEEAIISWSFEPSNPLQLRVVNVMGQLVYETTIEDLTEREVRLNVDEWAPGTYHVLIVMESNSVHKKLVIIK